MEQMNSSFIYMTVALFLNIGNPRPGRIGGHLKLALQNQPTVKRTQEALETSLASPEKSTAVSAGKTYAETQAPE